MRQFDIILCVDIKDGISRNGDIPWNIPLDMSFFKTKTKTVDYPTQTNVLIMGRKTMQTLKQPLKDRYNFVLTNQEISCNPEGIQEFNFFNDFEVALKTASELPNVFNIFVIGGKEVYELALKSVYLRYIYINQIHNDFQCDKTFSFDLNKFVLRESMSIFLSDNVKFDMKKFELTQNGELNYLNLLKNLLLVDERKTRNATVKSTFSQFLTFDLNNGFPLLTTKKVNFRAIVEELLFFLRGDTNVSKLKEKNVNIWNKNTTKEFIKSVGLNYEENDMGPMYGFQLRHFGAEYKGCNFTHEGYDQISYVLDLLKHDPYSRRIIMTTYNPQQAKEGVLYPCHGICIQFYVDNFRNLHCSVYQRSADIFLGVPFNIASYALLTHIFADLNGFGVGNITLFFGDCHLYSDHINAAKIQLSRLARPFPKLLIIKPFEIKSVEEFSTENFILENYSPHDYISAPMIA